jgi:hypothetical protein
MVPYYLLDPLAPIAQAFDYVEIDWAKYLVSIGAILSLSACLYASMFPLPRVVYCKFKTSLLKVKNKGLFKA